MLYKIAMKALDQIAVPHPRPDEIYQTKFAGQTYTFKGLKELLGKADFNKAGERNAGLCARSEIEREAARSALSKLTLQHLFDRPLVDNRGQVDSIMRVNYEIDLSEFKTIANKTLGEIKGLLLSQPEMELKKIGSAITGVMAAALAKICDVHELIFIARKIERVSKARTTLGLRGRLSSRLQANHPTDDLRGIELLTYWGLSLASGDALFGLNPAIDTVDNISRVLHHLDKIRRATGAPTQVCVLAHVKTQLACLAQGAPVEVIFQSLAGTEETLTTEFDVTVDLLDRAYSEMKERGPLCAEAKQFMYFETGQGSEFTYGKHQGIDMATTEALCYGLARRYDPYMVNNVTGFIGPETHYDSQEMILSSLQDHFMGKLLGVPMGMAPCYTLHSKITLEGQQISTELLTAAGANFYMDVALNTDRMLAYFDTSGHDNQTLREVYGKLPTPEYHEWAIQKGILDEKGNRGPHWGNVRRFCESDAHFEELKKATPALYGFETAGPRPSNQVSRELRMNQAFAIDAVYSDLDAKKLFGCGNLRTISTRAATKEAHLNSPSLGSFLSEETTETLLPENTDIQIVLSDGLSAEAIHANVPTLLPLLEKGLKSRDYKIGQTILAPRGRVKLAEAIAEKTQTKLVVFLIGERPGGDAAASRSLSAYLVYRLNDAETQKKAAEFSQAPKIAYEYTVISNIYDGGVPPVEAASIIAEKAWEILKFRAAGNRLESLKTHLH